MIHTNLKAGDASHLGPLLLLLLFVKNKQRKIKPKKNAQNSGQQVKAETVRLAECTLHIVCVWKLSRESSGLTGLFSITWMHKRTSPWRGLVIYDVKYSVSLLVTSDCGKWCIYDAPVRWQAWQMIFRLSPGFLKSWNPETQNLPPRNPKVLVAIL